MRLLGIAMYICGEAATATLNPDSGGYQTTAISDFTFLIKKEFLCPVSLFSFPAGMKP